jgi:predicted RNA methylase
VRADVLAGLARLAQALAAVGAELVYTVDEVRE